MNGYWIATQLVGSSEITISCSNCKDEFIGQNDLDTWRSVYHFCPSCGVRMNNAEVKLPWKLLSETDSFVSYGYERYRQKFGLFFNKANCSCTGTYAYFEPYDEDIWATTEFPNEFVKFSAKYGRWQSYELQMDIDTVEFIQSILRKIKLGDKEINIE
jgi:hypothetical protein